MIYCYTETNTVELLCSELPNRLAELALLRLIPFHFQLSKNENKAPFSKAVFYEL